jgi:hypothetical protein
LARQLPRRTEDFKTFKLPKPDEWKTLQGKLSRPEQIKFLADRLRLLNCWQWGQPGGVNYEDEQYCDPDSKGDKSGKVVINPYNELRKMKLQIADLPTLVPYLADEDYMLVFSYWRDFHPSRTLHQVNWAIAGLLNETAKRDLAELATFTSLDEAGRKKHLDRLLAWCKANAGKTREELLLDTLAKARGRAFLSAANELVADKNVKALPILLERMKEWKDNPGEIVRLCYGLDSAGAVKPARDWLRSQDEETRFYAALILLRHGDKAQAEGLEPLKEVLAKDDGSYYYPRAIDDLLGTKSEVAMTLASAILRKSRFHSEFNSGEILRRLFLAGRQEALNYAVSQLDNTEEASTSSGIYKGKEVQRKNTRGDGIAGQIAEWRIDDWKFETLAADEERKAKREQLKPWLREQFACIKKGEKPQMRTEIRPLHHAEWHVDAP